MRTDTGDLEDESTIIVQEIIDLTKECLVTTDTNVLNMQMSMSILNMSDVIT